MRSSRCAAALRRSRLRARTTRKARPAGASRLPQASRPRRPRPQAAEARPSAANGKLTPQALAAARLDAAHSAKFDRSRYETVRSARPAQGLDRRARATGLCRDRHRDHEPRSDAGDAVRLLARAGAERGLLRAAVAPPGRRRQRRPVRRRASRPIRSPRRDALDALKPLLEDPGVLKIGQNLKFDWQMFAQRGIEIASYDDTHADVLCARCRPRRSRPRCAGAALFRSHAPSTSTR